MNNTKANILSKLMRLQNKEANKYLSSFADDLVVSINNHKSNDQILEDLELFDKIVYVVPKQTLKAIKSIINNQNPLKPKIRTVKLFGKIEGKKHIDLVIECVDLLGKICYSKPKEVFSLLIKLLTYPDQAIQSKAKEILKRMAEYNLFALREVGYQYQLFLLNEIEKWGSRKLINLFDIVIEIARQLLSPTFEGHEMQNYKTMALHSGTLKVNEELKNIRERTIEILKKLYLYTKELNQQEKAIHALREATQEPISSGYGKDMECMVQGNTNVLIDYYISIVPKADNEIIKIIEENIRFIHIHRNWKLPRAKKLLTIIESNKAYEMFRIFVGYDYRFLEDLDRNKAKDDRETKIQEFIKDISDKNYKTWEGKILSVIKNFHKSGDKGEYMYFNIFLNKLSKQKPDVACKLITNNETELEPFLIHLLGGIWESSLKDHAKSLISKWVDEGKHICVCACVFEYVNDVDEPLIDKIIKKAKKLKNTDALIYIIRLIDRRYPKNKNTTALFVSIVKEFTKHSNYRWIDQVWHNKDSVLKLLTKADCDIILDNLLLVPDFNSYVEGILMPIAEKYPKQVIVFFYKRVSIQLKKRQKDRYRAIPFELYKIKVPFNKNAKIVVPEILKWFSKKDRIFYSQACLLLHAIFPSFNNILKKELIRLVKTKSDKSAEIVIDILRQYEGEECLHNVCKEFVKTYSKNDKYDMEIFHILSQMGVVSGEHGFAEGYGKKKESIQDWKKDKNRAIQSFVKKYEDYLDRQISFEQKRADERLELRKREFRN